MKTEQVQEHFRAQVPAYSELMQRIIPYYDQQRDLMVSLMPQKSDRPLRVLDLGCGPGALASRLAAEFPSAELTLFDLTAEMIDRCRAELGGNPRVSFRVGNFREDDFGGEFDVILASLSLHHATVAERPQLARRLFGALRPGGRLITTEVIVDDSLEVRDRQYALWRGFMDSQGEDGAAWFQKHLAKDHPVSIPEWSHLLAEAGFVSPGCFWRYLNFAIFCGWRSAV